jgi:hypothetical protein
VDAVLVESPACHLCEDAAGLLGAEEAAGRVHLRRVALDSAEGRALVRATRAPMPPVVFIDGELLGWGRLSRGKLARRLAQLHGAGQ